MSQATQAIGIAGEEVAAKYLIRNNHEIRERNIRFGRYEIDIIAWDKARQMMVFVEVKTRSSVSELYPIHGAVDKPKRRSIRAAIGRWVVARQYDGPGRIDLLCISGERIVEHWMDVGSDFR